MNQNSIKPNTPNTSFPVKTGTNPPKERNNTLKQLNCYKQQ